MTRAAAVALLAALVIVAGAGCRAGDTPGAEDEPGNRELRVERALRDIDQYPRSERVQTTLEPDLVVVSFVTQHGTPEQVIRHFADTLGTAGWTNTQRPAPTESGADSWRGRWTMGERRVLVSVGSAPAADPSEAGADQPVTQYSVTIRRSAEE